MRGRRLWVKSALEITCSSFPGSELDWSENSNYEADMYVLLHLAVWSSWARCLHSPTGSRRNSSSADTRLAFLFLFESPALSWSIFCTYILNVFYIFHRRYLKKGVSFLIKKKKKKQFQEPMYWLYNDLSNVHRVHLSGAKFLLKWRPTFTTNYITLNVKMRDFIRSSVPGNAHLWIYLHVVFSVSWDAK